MFWRFWPGATGIRAQQCASFGSSWRDEGDCGCNGSPTSCEAVRAPFGNSACRLPIEPGNTRTTGLMVSQRTPRSESAQHLVSSRKRRCRRVLGVHAEIQSSFRVARHRLKAIHHRVRRERDFNSWKLGTCVRCEKMHATTAGSRFHRRKLLGNALRQALLAWTLASALCASVGTVAVPASRRPGGHRPKREGGARAKAVGGGHAVRPKPTRTRQARHRGQFR